MVPTLEHIAPPLFGALHIFYYLNVRNFLSVYICKTMDMPAYHTLHVLKDVQIENQHEKTKTPLNIWCITILSLEVHILRELIESMHEDPLVMLGISP